MPFHLALDLQTLLATQLQLSTAQDIGSTKYNVPQVPR
jgi:hypothetical protein